MRAILVALIDIAQRTGRWTVAEATAAYNGLWRILYWTLLACAIVFVLNAGLGWKMPSLILLVAVLIVAAYVWAKPLNLLVVAGAGVAAKVATDGNLAAEVEGALKLYLDLLKWVLVVVVTFLFITGTFSFKSDPAAILSVLGGLAIIVLFSLVWPKVFIGTWGRRLVYGFAVLVIVMSFARLVLGPVVTQVQEKLVTTTQQQLQSLVSGKAPATAPQSQQQLPLPMQPYGDTTRYTAGAGRVMEFGGKNFTSHCIFKNGRHEEYPAGSTQHCGPGELDFQFARDTSGQPNSVTYREVPH